MCLEIRIGTRGLITMNRVTKRDDILGLEDLFDSNFVQADDSIGEHRDDIMPFYEFSYNVLQSYEPVHVERTVSLKDRKFPFLPIDPVVGVHHIRY